MIMNINPLRPRLSARYRSLRCYRTHLIGAKRFTDMAFYTDKVTVPSWEDFIGLTTKNNNWGNWILRGQTDWKWTLKTTLERSAENMGIGFVELPKLKQGMIRKFKRQYAHFSSDLPSDDDYIEWLSIMQHFGAPTRLLDFSYSI